MKICDGNEAEKKDHFIAGHLYEWKLGSGKLRLCIKPGPNSENSPLELIDIKTGRWVSSANSCHETAYEDVTDQYCLKKEDRFW